MSSPARSNTTQRMLRLLSLLQNGQSWTGERLSQALDTSPRTLRRDIDKLRELGYPVTSLRGPGGSYRLAAGNALPPLMFEDDEVVALALGLRHVAAGHSSLDNVTDAAERATRKLAQVLPSRLARQVSMVAAAVEPEPRQWPGAHPDTVAVLGEAIADGRWVRMTHRTKAGEEARRKVDPYRLLLHRGRWYLFAWDRDREDWRMFRVDRIVSAESARASFVHRSLPAEDLHAYVEERFSSSPRLHTVAVRFAASANEVASRIVRIDGALEALSPTTCRYAARVDSYEWLAIVLALSGIEFVVERPDSMRDYLRELGGRLTAGAGEPG